LRCNPWAHDARNIDSLSWWAETRILHAWNTPEKRPIFRGRRFICPSRHNFETISFCGKFPTPKKVHQENST
ncbi:MAG: hypothetical protein L0312_30130, partial [Acidobacteria bacterium]|nr:hypothetical protein [Acidobacteriota bacterium]